VQGHYFHGLCQDLIVLFLFVLTFCAINQSIPERHVLPLTDGYVDGGIVNGLQRLTGKKPSACAALASASRMSFLKSPSAPGLIFL
jgi:hypothetical protein